MSFTGHNTKDCRVTAVVWLGNMRSFTSLNAAWNCTKFSAALIFLVVASVPKFGPCAIFVILCSLNDMIERNSFHGSEHKFLHRLTVRFEKLVREPVAIWVDVCRYMAWSQLSELSVGCYVQLNISWFQFAWVFPSGLDVVWETLLEVLVMIVLEKFSGEVCHFDAERQDWRRRLIRGRQHLLVIVADLITALFQIDTRIKWS